MHHGPSRLHLALAAVLGLALSPTVARADKASPTDKQRIVGILDVRGPSPADEAAFEKKLESQLDTNQYWLAPRAKMRERLSNSTKWTEGCLVHHCLTEAKVQTGAELVVLAALDGKGTSFGFVVTLVRTDTGKVIAQESERCDVCTFTETVNAATLATIKLLNAVPEQLPDETAQAGAAVDLAVDAAVRPYQRRVAAARRTQARAGIALTLVGLAVAAGGTALYLLADDEPDYAIATAAAGGGLALGGLAVLTF